MICIILKTAVGAPCLAQQLRPLGVCRPRSFLFYYLNQAVTLDRRIQLRFLGLCLTLMPKNF